MTLDPFSSLFLALLLYEVQATLGLYKVACLLVLPHMRLTCSGGVFPATVVNMADDSDYGDEPVMETRYCLVPIMVIIVHMAMFATGFIVIIVVVVCRVDFILVVVIDVVFMIPTM